LTSDIRNERFLSVAVIPILRSDLGGSGASATAAHERERRYGNVIRKLLVVVLFGVAIAPLCPFAFAHHGVAYYDVNHQVSLKGVVTNFKFANPHTEIFFDVKNEKGVVEHWIGEATTPNMLSRRGWDRSVIKAGDQITVTGNPSKDGSNAMRVQKIVFADGRVLDPNAEF